MKCCKKAMPTSAKKLFLQSSKCSHLPSARWFMHKKCPGMQAFNVLVRLFLRSLLCLLDGGCTRPRLKMETKKWMEWEKSNSNRATAKSFKSFKFIIHPNSAQTKTLLPKLQPILEVESKKIGDRCDYGFMIEWLWCWGSRALGQGFCFGLQHSKSFNFESDLIYELDATQHTQVKVEVHLFSVVADFEDSSSVSICALLLHIGRPKMHSSFDS